MFKTYDVQCQKCGYETEILIDDKEDFPSCGECGGEVKRIYTSMNFKLIYNNKTDMCSWGDHGYATSQYWSKIKEERAKGKDVKSPDE